MNDNKIITTEDGEEINLSALEREFGSYDFEGHTYYAARQMELTNRLFAGCYNDAEDGDEYTEEYSAPGYDENGNPVEIFMTFTQVKGEEIDPETLTGSRTPTALKPSNHDSRAVHAALAQL